MTLLVKGRRQSMKIVVAGLDIVELPFYQD